MQPVKQSRAGVGATVSPVSGKPFSEGSINMIYMVYRMLPNAIQRVSWEEQKRAVSRAPRLTSDPFASRTEFIRALLGSGRVNANWQHARALLISREIGESLRAIIKCLLHLEIASKFKKKKKVNREKSPGRFPPLRVFTKIWALSGWKHRRTDKYVSSFEGNTFGSC